MDSLTDPFSVTDNGLDACVALFCNIAVDYGDVPSQQQDDRGAARLEPALFLALAE